jgi:hypothetical protein
VPPVAVIVIVPLPPLHNTFVTDDVAFNAVGWLTTMLVIVFVQLFLSFTVTE